MKLTNEISNVPLNLRARTEKCFDQKKLLSQPCEQVEPIFLVRRAYECRFGQLDLKVRIFRGRFFNRGRSGGSLGLAERDVNAAEVLRLPDHLHALVRVQVNQFDA